VAYLKKIFFIPRNPKTTRNNRSSPNNGPIKNFLLKSYYLCITNIEIVQNSKSKPKKFSFLCTFNSKRLQRIRNVQEGKRHKKKETTTVL